MGGSVCAHAGNRVSKKHATNLLEVADFLLERLDIALVQLHRVLVGLEPLRRPGLRRRCRGLLLRQGFLGVVETLLLGGQFLFEDGASVTIARLLLAGADLGKVAGVGALALALGAEKLDTGWSRESTVQFLALPLLLV